jgi:hypothetical protein
MQKVIILTFLLFSEISTFTQVQRPAYDDFSFYNGTYNKSLIKKNKIQIIKVQNYYKGNTPSNICTYYFNSEGILTHYSRFDSSETKALAKLKFTFNLFNDLTRIEENNYETTKTYITNISRTYSKNLLVKDSSGETLSATAYYYNTKNKLIKTIINPNCENNGIARVTTAFTYDKNNIITKVTEQRQDYCYDSTSFFTTSERDLSYNKEGKITEEVEAIPYNQFLPYNHGNIKYEYDKMNNLIKIERQSNSNYYISYNSKGLITAIINVTNIDGKRMEIRNEYSYCFSGN